MAEPGGRLADYRMCGDHWTLMAPGPAAAWKGVWGNLNRIKGCLVGGAVGDALGYAVEFSTLSEIIRKFGESGIKRYELDGGLARISDDTQMALFTANALLFGETRGQMRGIGAGPAGYFTEAYLDWYETQTEKYPLRDYHSSWLVNFREFFSRRAPGGTCMSALQAGGRGTVERPVNNSKGCGGVMRVAPIGVYFAGKAHWEQEKVDMAGAKAAAVTHGHELGYIPSAALVHIVCQLASAEKPDVFAAVLSSMEAMPKLFPEAGFMRYYLDLMDKAIDLSQKDVDDRNAIRQLGEGWVAEETLAIAVYCAIKHADSFEDAIVASVNHDGDSDSTGAVTGNILGTALGYTSIPDHYLEKLELRDIIEEISEDLYNDCQMSEYSDYRDPVWESKYIYVNYDKKKRAQLRK